MSQYGDDIPGDNIEFTAIDTGEYEIFLTHNTKTSADDTATEKYPNNPKTARKFIIRTNRSTDLLELNGVTFTNPITIILNKAHIETRNNASIFKMKLRTSVENTTIKVRWF